MTTPDHRPGFGRRPGSWLRRQAIVALVPLLVVLVLGGIFNRDGAFFRWDTHQSLLREISVHGILACGMTVVIITGGIDLAVGSLLALSAVSVAILTMQVGAFEPLAFASVLLLGLLAGATSGAIVAFSRIQSFIVTLAMMVFARGLAKQLSEGKKVTSYVVDETGSGRLSAYPELMALLDRRLFDESVSVVSLVYVACAALTWVLLSRFRVGRYLYAVGGNLEAARLAGVPVRSTLVTAYAVSGLFAAVAGICQAAQETQGDPETGAGYELSAIAMVVLGGTSLAGGRGHIGLTLIGTLTLGYVQKILSLNAFSIESRLMLTGVILIGAVLFQKRFVV